LGELQEKLKKYQSEYDTMAHDLDKFVSESERESSQMKSENEVNKKEGEYL
jgi:hypothetical protein